MDNDQPKEMVTDQPKETDTVHEPGTGQEQLGVSEHPVMAHGQSHIKSENATPPVTTQASNIGQFGNTQTPKAMSRSSSSSTRSKLSSVVMQQRAKAEVAKVRLQFAEKEAKMLKLQAEQQADHQKQQADIKANLIILHSKLEVEETKAELRVMEDVLDDEQDRQSCMTNIQKEVVNRTNDYVNDQQKFHLEKDFIPRHFTYLQSPHPVKLFHSVPELSDANEQLTHSHKAPQSRPECNDLHDRQLHTQLKPDAPEFYPAQQLSSGVSDLTKYIMKKDLLLSRLSKYDDSPERYLVWKTSFQNIMRELEVTPSEELDLLTRWLGPESSKQVLSLRASNAHDETIGLAKVWQRLDERYGAPEFVEISLRQRLESFPKLSGKDGKKMYELADLLAEIESVKENENYGSLLAYFDSSCGINPIVQKLPGFLQTKWTDTAITYKIQHNVLYPPFSVFVRFVRNMSIRMNDPGFQYDSNAATSGKQGNVAGASGRSAPARHSAGAYQAYGQSRTVLSAKKTDIENTQITNENIGHKTGDMCPLHGENARHTLNDCRMFQELSISDKKDIILKNGICFKCCSGKHLARDCTKNIKCEQCGSKNHCSNFHIDKQNTTRSHGGEQAPHGRDSEVKNNNQISSKCTQICGQSFTGKSCAKTVLVNIYPEGNPEKTLTAYALIDDQSNRSLARSELFDHFQEDSNEIEYMLSSCAGNFTASGRTAHGYIVESLDGECRLPLPTLIECNDIPNNEQEIPTPTVARHHRHLKDIERFIPEYDPKNEILLLIGRDLISAHHVLDQRLGTEQEPYAQKLKLGWVIVGETCLGAVHHQDTVTVKKTHILKNGRASLLKPCSNDFEIQDRPNDVGMGETVFHKTKDDDIPGLSREDKQFLDLMESEFTKTPEGNWSAPLPFRKGRPRLGNNYEQARQRADNLTRSLKKNPVKQDHFCEFMDKMFSNGHAEVAPPLREAEECWYLPIFGVYHPKKPEKIRVVFDSSAKFGGLSLNDVLLTGPDLTNSLMGVLVNFRKDKVAITADIEQMFFSFHVHEEHRNFLRFLWFKDNDPGKEMVEHRMRVHVFGNSPSPAVATVGLRKSACNHSKDKSHCDDICELYKIISM